ncbi:unnamed protein product [Diplocarpon coronariae]
MCRRCTTHEANGSKYDIEHAGHVSHSHQEFILGSRDVPRRNDDNLKPRNLIPAQHLQHTSLWSS